MYYYVCFKDATAKSGFESGIGCYENRAKAYRMLGDRRDCWRAMVLDACNVTLSITPFDEDYSAIYDKTKGDLLGYCVVVERERDDDFGRISDIERDFVRRTVLRFKEMNDKK